MKREIKSAISLLTVIMMLMSLMPAGVWAQETNGETMAVDEQGSMSVNSTQDARLILETGVQTESAVEQVNQSTNQVVDLPQLSTTEASQTEEIIQTDAVLRGYEYEDVDGGVRIIKYNGSQADVVIPSTLDGKNVVEIGVNAFEGIYEYSKLIQTVTIPEGVKTISDSAFYYCYNLSKIVIPASVTNIGERVFYNTFDKECSVAIYGENGSYAQSYATANSILFVDPSGSNENGFYFTEIEGGVCITNYNGNGGVVDIPSTLGGKTVVAIGDKAFWGQKSITRITLSSNIISIGNSAFSNCENVTEITMNEGLQSIGSNAFERCVGLTGIVIPDSVTTIAETPYFINKQDGLFMWCLNLKTVVIGTGLTVIPANMFIYCNNLETVTFKGELTTIGSNAFYSCRVLTRIVIPSSVSTIGDNVFQYCTNTAIYGTKGSYAETYANANGIPFIDESAFNENGFWYANVNDGVCVTNYTGNGGSLTIPSTVNGKKVVAIGDKAFAGKTNITKVILGSNVLTIGRESFRDCSALTEIVFNNGLTTIGSGAFLKCVALSNINIPDSVTTLGSQTDNYDSGVFVSCSNLSSVTLGKGITSIPNYLFYKCSNLETINFEGPLTTIGNYPFLGCTSLYKLVIPSSVTTIENNGLTGLPYLSIYGTSGSYVETYAKEKKIPFVDPANPDKSGFLYVDIDGGVRILRYVGTNAVVTIPATLDGKKVLEIGSGAFANQRFITKVTLGNNVLSIGKDAFMGCTGLTSMDIPDSVNQLGNGIFGDCTDLKTVKVGKGITSIPDNMFYNCTSLEITDLPDGVGTIGMHAFQSCSSLKDITIPDKTTSIGIGSFVYCDQLTNVNFGTSLNSIKEEAFYGCKSLKAITLPSSLTSIEGRHYGVGAFGDCPTLTQVTVPESVTNISEITFENSFSVGLYGKKGTYAETYANTYGIPFFEMNTLESIAITTPATKLSYKTGEALDLTGLVVTGTYSDGTAKPETITNDNITGFDSAKAVANQVLTITVKGKTTTYSIQITESGDPTQSGFVAFLSKDPSGTYYEYNAVDLNNAYLAYQINPALPSAKMYQQFLNSQCKVVGLKDGTKGYMDYNATATASLMAQMKGQAFDINAYFAGADAKSLAESVGQVKVVGKDGNIQ